MKDVWEWFTFGLAALGMWGVVLGASFVVFAGLGVFMSLGRLVGPLFALPIIVATFVSAAWVGNSIHKKRRDV